MFSSLGSMTVSSHLPMDLTDLIRGEGEWTNMQDVIRKTFKITFLHLQKQQEQIDKLIGVTSTLKDALSTKMTEKEVEILLSKHDRVSNKTSNEFTAIFNQQLCDLKADIERKASVRYVDDSLRRKVDKSEVLMKTAQGIANSSSHTNSLQSVNSDLMKLNGDYVGMKIKIENIEKNAADYKEQLKSLASSSELLGIQNQLNQVFQLVQQCPKKEEIVRLYDKKIDRKDVEKLLHEKAEKTIVSSALNHLETVVTNQEKNIASLRFKLHDITVSGSNENNPINSPSPVARNSNRNLNSKHQNSDLSDGLYKLDGVNQNEYSYNTMDLRLKDGRDEAVINSLTQKVTQISRDLQRIRSETKVNADRICSVETAVDTVVSQTNTEGLHTGLNEIRRKLEGLILGTVTIKPLEECIHALSSKVEEIKNFLQLPQLKPLKSQISEILNSVERVSLLNEELQNLCKNNEQNANSLVNQNTKIELRVRNLESRLSQNTIDNLIDEKINGSTKELNLNLSTNFQSEIESLKSLVKNYIRISDNKGETAGNAGPSNEIDKLELDLELKSIKRQFNKLSQDSSKTLQGFTSNLNSIYMRQDGLEKKFEQLKVETITTTKKAVQNIAKEMNTIFNKTSTSTSTRQQRASVDMSVGLAAAAGGAPPFVVSKHLVTKPVYSESAVSSPIYYTSSKQNVNYGSYSQPYSVSSNPPPPRPPTSSDLSPSAHYDEVLRILEIEKEVLKKEAGI